MTMLQFDFSVVDWSEDSISPFDQHQHWGDHDAPTTAKSHEDSSVTSSSSSSSRTSQSTIIRFASHVKVFEVPHINDYTTEEIQATWFQPEEIREMRNQVRLAASRLEEKEQLHHIAKEDAMCTWETTLGLEGRTIEGIRRRNEQVKAGYDAVFGEQLRQRMVGEQDPESISAAYQWATTSAGYDDYNEQSSKEYSQWVDLLI